MPPVSSALRSIWPRVLGEDDARTAYALEAALQEAIFVGGPLVVAVLAALWAPAGVLGAAVFAAIGTLAFVRLEPVRAAGAAEHRHGSPLGALSSPGVRTITLLALFLGLAFASVEIAVPAFAEAHGGRALAGVALAGFAAGSLVGGLAAGLRPSSDEPRRMLLGASVLACALALPLLSTSLAAMTVLLFVTGLPIAPTIAAAYGIIGRVAALGSVAEAFSWFGTAVSTGFAGGAIAGGRLIDDHGWRASVALAVGFAALGVLLAALRGGTLTGPPDAPAG
jgi:predicted MFS family arabinose efflux permease